MVANININNENRIFKIFTPGKKFPSISLSGSKCDLNCAHCGKQYLKEMLVAETPDKLILLCDELEQNQAQGALISGGCDQTGQVVLEPFVDALTEIKKRTKLILNVHTGLPSKTIINDLAKTGIDVVSIDVVGDEETINKVYHLKHKPEEYKKALVSLKTGGIKRIVPHICIGLNYGKIKGEYRAIDIISEIKPAALVFIIMIPTEGTMMARCEPPAINDILELIEYARSTNNDLPIFLGCMRPRTKQYRKYIQDVEIKAINTGIDGIVLPSKNTVKYLLELEQNQRFHIEQYNMCCAII